MALDPQQLKKSFFNVLKSDSAGASVRAALGNGASSVISADALHGTLPTAPFIALRGGPITGRRYDTRRLFLTWWIYDDAGQDFWRINGLLGLIEAAYATDQIARCYTDLSGISQELVDAALSSRPARSIGYVVSTRA